MIIEKNEFGEEIKMIDGEEMHITFNGSWIPAFNCLCKIKCAECDEEINLHEDDTMAEHCLVCYWRKRDIADDLGIEWLDVWNIRSGTGEDSL